MILLSVGSFSMTSLKQWLQTHMSAILATAITVSKAGLLGKAGSTLVAVLAAAFSAASN